MSIVFISLARLRHNIQPRSKQGLRAEMLRVDAFAPQVVLQSLWIILFLVFILAAIIPRCFLYEKVPLLTPDILGKDCSVVGYC